MATVSAVMSVYNGEKFLAAALSSLRAQTLQDFECIVVNDGSTDGTSGILREIASSDSRFLIIEQTNQGLTAGLIRGCREAKGKYIARLDADDIASPDRFARQCEYMDTHPEIAACGCLGWYIDENGKTVGEKNLPTDYDAVKRKLLTNNQFIHSGLFFRAAVFRAGGGYRPDFKKSQDYELMLRLAARHPVVNLPERLIYWRVRADSLSWKDKRQEIDAMRARVLAIICYGYPKLTGIFHIGVRLFWLIIPQRLKIIRYAR